MRQLILVLVLAALPLSARAANNAPGFPRKLEAAAVTPPLVADVDGDGYDDLVLVAGSELLCVTRDGHACQGFPVSLGEKVAPAGGPAAGDLDGDGRPELAVTTTAGQLLTFTARGEPFRPPVELGAGCEAGPSIADLDRDGKGELIAGNKVGQLHVYGPGFAERAGFPAAVGGSVTSAASVGLLGDPAALAIVVGGEDGKVYAFDAAARTLAGFPVSSKYIVSGQPAIADLDGDSRNDVAFTSQDFSVYAVRGDGRAFAGYPVSLGFRIFAGPAVFDVEGDGTLELAVGGSDGRLHVLRLDGKEAPGFPVKLGEKVQGPVVAADLDRDGRDELLAAADAQLHVLKANGRTFAGFPARIAGEALGGPVAGVLGSDGAVTAAVATAEKLFAFKQKAAGKPVPLTWAMSGHDASRTGRRQPNPPVYADLAIGPRKPTVLTALSASWRFFDLDGDAEPALALRWFRDGKEVPEAANRKELAAGLARKHEKWSFEVGEGAAAKKSAALEVGNTPPTAPKIAFVPDVPRRGEALEAKVVEEARDADGDKPTYRWSVLIDGKPQKQLAREGAPPKLAALTLKRGSKVAVTAVPFDGDAEGQAVTIEATVADSAPSAPAIAFDVAAPRTGDALTAVVKTPATDADGDAVTHRYRFFVDGASQPFASEVKTLPAFLAKKKQAVTVEVTAFDGELLGPAASAKVIVANTPPTAPKPALFPANPRAGATLVPGLAAPSLDADGDAVSYRFTLFKDGKKVEASEAVNVKKGEAWEVEAVASDGEADSAPARAKVVVGNTPPAPPQIAFADEAPKAGEPVAVRVDKPASDVDGDPLTLEYRWTVDGKPASMGKDATSIPAGRTKKGERWAVDVVAHDKDSASSPAHAELRVANDGPGAPRVALEPADPTAVSGVRAKLVEAAKDRDGDKLAYRYAWFVNGARLEANAEQLAPGAVKRGDTVRVRVVASDGEAEGPAAEATGLTRDSAPAPPQIALEPGKPTVLDALTCAVKSAAKDPDGERPALRFSWTLNGARLPMAADADQLAAGVAHHGDAVTCEVVATDGELSSAAARAEAKVGNVGPTAPRVVIEPKLPRAGDALACLVDQPATDADADVPRYDFRFTEDGKPVESAEPGRLDGKRVRKGHRYGCEATAKDGEASVAAKSAEVVVGNRAPGAAVVGVRPERPAPGDELVCDLLQPAFDADGDAVRYQFKWFRGGVEQPFVDASNSVPGRLVKADDLWRCAAMASDGESAGPLAESADVVVERTR